MIHCVTVDSAPAQRWRNGGGNTRELLAWPAADGWLVRVSVADIAADGPFSPFAGVDRRFAVIEGGGVSLRFGDRCETLALGGPPLAFDGAQAPDCTLLDGATRDLNLMTRRDAGQGGMLRAEAGAEWHSAAGWRALFTREAVRLRVDDADALALPAMSLAWSGRAAGQRWRLSGDGTPPLAWWLQFAAAAP